jgi:lysophospholipase L1-like esterase
MNKIKLVLISFIALALFLVGCSLDAPTEKQTVLKTGTGNFTSYVALGNSITAGFQSGALTQKHQVYSYPNLLAEQMGVGNFEQPLLAYPGLGAFTADSAGILQLVMLASPTTGNPVITPVPYTDYAAYMAMPYVSVDVATYAAPYNNLGVPGAVTYDMLYAYDADHCAAARAGGSNQMFNIVLRNVFNNPPTTYTPVQLAGALKPSFITCWIGNNDVLGYATSGGTSPATPTLVADFTALYTGLLNTLTAIEVDTVTTSQVVVANIPDVTTIPFFTTIPYMVDVPNIGPVALVIQTGAGAIRQATAADLILLPASSVIGDVSGTYGPQGVPVGLNGAAPLPNSLVLDADEVVIAQDAVQAFNGVIAAQAAAHELYVVDIYGIFNGIKANGYSTGGIDFSTNFITGGIFSLDGVHPSDIGHAIIANEFIKVINTQFKSTIPPVNIVEFSNNVSLKMSAKNIRIPGPDAFKSVIAACGGIVR